MEGYELLIQRKRHRESGEGFAPSFFHHKAFDYQNFCVDRLCNRGRGAAFLDTGMGKTLVELLLAHNHVLHTNRRVLILTPLAVAFQFLKEAAAFDIPDVAHTKEGHLGDAKILVCNYERLKLLSPNSLDCVILDESSILKNFDGAIKGQVTEFMKRVRYRYLFTATPSPNDYFELGTSSEALGYMGYMDMLSKYFTNKVKSIKSANLGDKHRLKPHAEAAFFDWVSSWAIAARKPSDLGPFSDERHVLPNLFEQYHVIQNNTPLSINGQMQIFATTAKGVKEINAEARVTTQQRAEKAFALSARKYDYTVYWCNTDFEAAALREIDSDAVEISGKMRMEQKEDILQSFSNGDIGRLITKPKITSFGLNWQHCNHAVIFPNYSFEQLYQMIRRFYRFGQTRDVYADMVFSDGQLRVLEAIQAKKADADRMFTLLTNNVKEAQSVITPELADFSLPSFIKQLK